MTSSGRKAHTAKERALKIRRTRRDAAAAAPRVHAIAMKKAEAEAEHQAEIADKNLTEYELFNGVNPYEYTAHDAMLDRIDNYTERAKFFERFQSRPDLLELLENSPDYLSANRTEV